MTNVEAETGRLAGRVALVTGASRGIGAATARAFVAEGASVALGCAPTAERVEQAKRLADELVAAGGRAVALEADLAVPDGPESLVAEARAALGTLDIVVNNAAASGAVPWRELTVDQWDYVQNVNVRGSWLVTRAAYPDLVTSEHASVINVTSVMVETGQVGALHYTASKAAIIGMTRALARELGDDGIRVNAVMPGAIRIRPLEEYTEEQFDRMAGRQCLPQPGVPADLAGTFVFLASDDSSFTTGQVLNVDGGWVHY